MAGQQKKITEIVSTGRDKDIRVRYVKPETWQALSEVGKLLREQYIPKTIVKLIHNYKGDQDLIRQLQARNNQLHAACAKLQADREGSIKLIADFIKYTDRFNGMTVTRAKKILKQLNSKKVGQKSTRKPVAGR